MLQRTFGCRCVSATSINNRARTTGRKTRGASPGGRRLWPRPRDPASPSPQHPYQDQAIFIRPVGAFVPKQMHLRTQGTGFGAVVKLHLGIPFNMNCPACVAYPQYPRFVTRCPQGRLSTALRHRQNVLPFIQGTRVRRHSFILSIDCRPRKPEMTRNQAPRRSLSGFFLQNRRLT